MLHIPKMDDYLEILTDEEIKDSVAINFGEYFKSIREEENLSVYIAVMLRFFYPELQLINIKPMIKNKLKELLSELKRFKVQENISFRL